MSDSAKWYVIHTYSGYENAVKTSIEKFVTGRGLEVQVTQIAVSRTKPAGGLHLLMANNPTFLIAGNCHG